MNNSIYKQGGNVVAKKLFGVWLLLATCVGMGSVKAQTVEYIHTDALGSSVAVTDANRNVIERSEYEPYGALLNRPISDGPGYTGHVMDAATGLTYMQQRYYDPTLGRFLSVDPVAINTNTGWNFNRYNYAANNSYKFKDPDGRIIDTVFDVAFIIADVINIASNGLNAENGASLAGNVVGALIPGATGLGKVAAAGVVAIRIADKAADSAKARRATGEFTPRQRKAFKGENATRNDGQMKCDDCAKPVRNVGNEKGVKTPSDQAQVHHDPAIKDGGGKHSEGKVLCPECHVERHRNEK